MRLEKGSKIPISQIIVDINELKKGAKYVEKAIATY